MKKDVCDGFDHIHPRTAPMPAAVHTPAGGLACSTRRSVMITNCLGCLGAVSCAADVSYLGRAHSLPACSEPCAELTPSTPLTCAGIVETLPHPQPGGKGWGIAVKGSAL